MMMTTTTTRKHIGTWQQATRRIERTEAQRGHAITHWVRSYGNVLMSKMVRCDTHHHPYGIVVREIFPAWWRAEWKARIHD